jgi:hypothetical protein
MAWTSDCNVSTAMNILHHLLKVLRTEIMPHIGVDNQLAPRDARRGALSMFNRKQDILTAM